MARKIMVEIEVAGTDLSQQKDIDLLREILTKYYNWAISGMTLHAPHGEIEIQPYKPRFTDDDGDSH